MKYFVIFFLLILMLPLSQAQTNMPREIGYEVRGNYKKSIKKSQLQTAETLNDINAGFPSSWIKEYISVEITGVHKGETKIATSTNNILNEQQLSILKQADFGTNIIVNVYYKTDQSIIGAETKNINFSYTVLPENEASYPGGYDLLKSFLKQNILDKLDKSVSSKVDMATVKFTIDKTGAISNVNIAQSSMNNAIDKLLLYTLSKMSKWTPATDMNNQKVAQDFILSFGNMVGC